MVIEFTDANDNRVDFLPSGRLVVHAAWAYSKHGCHCDRCTHANTVKVKRARLRRLEAQRDRAEKKVDNL